MAKPESIHILGFRIRESGKETLIFIFAEAMTAREFITGSIHGYGDVCPMGFRITYTRSC
jgi:hypothetical protein